MRTRDAAAGPKPERARVPQARSSQPAPKQRRPFAVIRRLFAFLSILVLIAVVGAAGFAWHTYAKYAAELPSLDGLRQYQPKVMSRLYAGDERLLSELATER